MRQLINQNGETHDFGYDAQGRLIRETGFGGRETVYRHDGAGHLIARHAGNGATDTSATRTAGCWSSGACPDPLRPGHRHHALPVRLVGNLLWVQDRDSELRFVYDDVDNLIEETQHVKLRQGDRTVERVFTLKHEVDELGNRIKTILPNGRQVGTQRYGSGHWIGTLWNGIPIADLERDDLHREKVRQLGRLTPNRNA